MNDYFERIAAHNTRNRNGKAAALPHLDIELTERCNNNCIHCWNNLPAEDTLARSREFPADEIKRVLGEAAALGCLTVRFTGGEPLIRDDFSELYVFARQLGIKVLLATNACLLTPSIADLFTRIPPQIEIDVSVYGMRVESYEAVTRIPGSFAQFQRGLSLLLDRNIPFVVSGALLPPNRSEKEAFEAWASMLPWVKSRPACAMLYELRKRRDHMKKSREIQKLRLPPEELPAILHRNPSDHLAWIESCMRCFGPADGTLFRCGAIHGGCLDAYGRCQPCMSLCAPEWTYDLHTGSLGDALAFLRAGIRNARAANPEYLERCARCFLRPLCGQCPARSWIENGVLDMPIEYLCSVAHAQARSSGLLRDDEKAWDILNWKDRIKLLIPETVQSNESFYGNKKEMVQT